TKAGLLAVARLLSAVGIAHGSDISSKWWIELDRPPDRGANASHAVLHLAQYGQQANHAKDGEDHQPDAFEDPKDLHVLEAGSDFARIARPQISANFCGKDGQQDGLNQHVAHDEEKH